MKSKNNKLLAPEENIHKEHTYKYIASLAEPPSICFHRSLVKTGYGKKARQTCFYCVVILAENLNNRERTSVLAHRNVRYNEVADQLAKFAAGLKEDPPHEDVIIKQLPTQLDMGTLMTFHKRRKRENWIGPGEVRHPPYIEALTRPEEVLMSRFRVGHCRSLIIKGLNELCFFCKLGKATAHHVLFICEHWCIETLREKYISHMMNDKGEEACQLEDCYLPANQQRFCHNLRQTGTTIRTVVLLKHRHFEYQH